MLVDSFDLLLRAKAGEALKPNGILLMPALCWIGADLHLIPEDILS